MIALTATAPAPVALRAAAAEDCAAIWRWNFAPDVRAGSRCTRNVPLADHARWFARALLAREPIWVIEEAGVGVGVVRLDAIGGGLTRISIALAANARGRGIGQRAVAAACHAWGQPIVAEIVAGNHASRACFEACGFCPLAGAGDLLTYHWDPET
jgi:UDP-2,4-diacetamido-2,4,6-trideoxy-beta-L-altropyranose hydrolase